MWQRFTERARRVVFFAQEEANRLGESHVSTEHMLLGLVRETDSVAARVLDRLGVSLSSVRAEVERQVSRGDGRLGQDMQLTPRVKRVIDLAYDEARQLNNNYIGSEHLLLGLIREGDGLAGRVLQKLGVDLEASRSCVIELQGTASAERPQAGKLRYSPRAQAALELAATEALSNNRDEVEAEDLLLGLIRLGGLAGKALEGAGLDIETARAKLKSPSEDTDTRE